MRPPPPLPRRGSGPNDAGLGRPVSNPISGPRTGPVTPGRPIGTGGPMPLPPKPRMMKKGGVAAKKTAMDKTGRAMKTTSKDAKGRAMKMQKGGYARKGK